MARHRRGYKWFHAEGHITGSGMRWHADEPEKTRHQILNAAVRNHSYAHVVRQLNALANVTKDSRTERIARADERYLHEKYRDG
jgi:hypothetical protein